MVNLVLGLIFVLGAVLFASPTSTPTGTPHGDDATPTSSFHQELADRDSPTQCDRIGRLSYETEDHDILVLARLCTEDVQFSLAWCVIGDDSYARSNPQPIERELWSGSVWVNCSWVIWNTGTETMSLSPSVFGLVAAVDSAYEPVPNPFRDGAEPFVSEVIAPETRGLSVGFADLTYKLPVDVDFPLRVEIQSDVNSDEVLGVMLLDGIRHYSDVYGQG